MRDMTMGYTGQRRSGVSGYYLLGNGYRGFNPVLKRFAGQDSMSPFGAGGEHGFAYCGGNPANNTDPSGHLLWEIFLAEFGSLMEFAAEEAAVIDGTSTAMASVEDSVAGKGFGTLYRYDQRQPRRVLATGFEGTNSDNHLFAAFGDETVFSARTKKGADIFRESAEREGFRTFFLYKINSEGLSAIDISSDFTFSEEDFLKKASEIKFNQKYQKYSSMTKYKRLGHDAFCEVIANTLREPIKNAFVPVRETHILGPVFPDRIKAVTPHFLDYLDLAW